MDPLRLDRPERSSTLSLSNFGITESCLEEFSISTVLCLFCIVGVSVKKGWFSNACLDLSTESHSSRRDAAVSEETEALDSKAEGSPVDVCVCRSMRACLPFSTRDGLVSEI